LLLEEILTHFPSKQKKTGEGYNVICPSHNDNKASLSISAGNDNNILMHCQAGCETKDILDAINLKWTDLYMNDYKEKASDNINYNYVDTEGKLIYQSVRKPNKEFRQRSPDGKGDWVWNLKGIKPLPYHLPQLIEAIEQKKIIFIVEGEKDVHTVERLGYTATTNSGGAGKWTDAHSEYFTEGTKVVILPDNDEPGLKHAKVVYDQLKARGCNVKVIMLPGLNEKGDISDWIAAGHTKEELTKLVQSPKVESADSAVSKPIINNIPISGLDNDNGTFTAINLMDMIFPKMKWIIEGILCEGATLMCGPPKLGKSWLALLIAMAVSSGGTVLGNEVEKGEVLYLALEDTKKRLQDRLKKLSDTYELSPLLYFQSEWEKMDKGGDIKLDLWLKNHPDCRMVIIDTLKMVRPNTKGGNNVYEIDYDAVNQLKRIADKNEVSFLIIHHINKGKHEDVLDSVSGSNGLTGAADSIIILTRERGKEHGNLFITGRDVEEQELAISFDKDSCTWNLLGDAKQYRIPPDHIRILEIMKSANIPLTPSQIAPLVGKSSDATKQIIGRMHNELVIIKVGHGKYVPRIEKVENVNPFF
jgi:5S rRNA maturation endonuclease (ribonuclease M5)